MNQASGTVVAGPLLLCIPAVYRGLQSSHKAGQKRNPQLRQCHRSTIGRLRHALRKIGQIFIEQGLELLQGLQRRPLRLRSDGFAGNQRRTARQSQLQNFGQVEPGVCGIAVIFAHNQRLLATGNTVVRQILPCHAAFSQGGKQRVIIEQRRCQTAGGKEEPAQFLIKFFRRILMEFHGQNGLGQVHLVVGVQDCICHRTGQVVAVGISAAYQHILRDGPAALSHVKEYQEVCKQCRCLFPAQTVCGTVWFKNSVGIAHRERKGIRRLFQTHNLPQQQKRLHRLISGTGSLGRYTGQCICHPQKSLPVRFVGLLCFPARQNLISPSQFYCTRQGTVHSP